MRASIALALLPTLLFGILGMASPFPNTTQSIAVSRRSYSVKTTKELRASGILRNAIMSPWPDTYERTTIPYCFRDQSSEASLSELFEQAVAHAWWPAFQYSSLFIAPACKTNSRQGEEYDYGCICGLQKDGSKTPRDALVIDDRRNGTKDQSKWGTEVESTVGYNRVVKKHGLWFGTINRKFPGHWSLQELDDELITHLVHELGHVIGLIQYVKTLGCGNA